jgi:hypothetical protein
MNMHAVLLTQTGFEHTHLQNKRLLHLLVQYQSLDRFISVSSNTYQAAS